jgi:hypothetical protein
MEAWPCAGAAFGLVGLAGAWGIAGRVATVFGSEAGMSGLARAQPRGEQHQ